MRTDDWQSFRTLRIPALHALPEVFWCLSCKSPIFLLKLLLLHYLPGEDALLPWRLPECLTGLVSQLSQNFSAYVL